MFKYLLKIVENELDKKPNSLFNLQDLETVFEMAVERGNDEGEVLGYKKCLNENFYGEDSDEDEIRDEAYREGHSDGYSEGNEDGRSEGHDESRKEGFDEGFDEGEKEGYNNGYSSGHYVGFDEGSKIVDDDTVDDDIKKMLKKDIPF